MMTRQLLALLFIFLFSGLASSQLKVKWRYEWNGHFYTYNVNVLSVYNAEEKNVGLGAGFNWYITELTNLQVIASVVNQDRFNFSTDLDYHCTIVRKDSLALSGEFGLGYVFENSPDRSLDVHWGLGIQYRRIRLVYSKLYYKKPSDLFDLPRNRLRLMYIIGKKITF
jgi:hypothetical protein